jgi:hypothetical protein
MYRGDAGKVRQLLFAIAGLASEGEPSGPRIPAAVIEDDDSLQHSTNDRHHESADFKPEPAGT